MSGLRMVSKINEKKCSKTTVMATGWRQPSSPEMYIHPSERSTETTHQSF